MKKIKAIIFDWGRTLYNNENQNTFPETREVLDYRFKKYRLGLISIVKSETLDERLEKIKNLELVHYFELTLFDRRDKNIIGPEAIQKFNLSPQEICVVDDRIQRMGWAISRGCKTIWIQKGKFAEELPNETTGFPTHKIHSLKLVTELI